MVRAVKRRQATVAMTRQLLEAVGYIRQQKQIPNLDRISKYMQREHAMGYAECRRHLDCVVEDAFIMEYTAVGFKGSRTGLEQEGYKIPTTEEMDLVSRARSPLSSSSSSSSAVWTGRGLSRPGFVHGQEKLEQSGSPHFHTRQLQEWRLKTSLYASDIQISDRLLCCFTSVCMLLC